MARKYDHEYKVQAVKLAKEIGGAKAAKELGIPEGTIHAMIPMGVFACIRHFSLRIWKDSKSPVSELSTGLWMK